MSVLLETTLGDIVIDLLTNERPRACLNFLKLCKIKYYNYCLFHSVQQNFLAQTGDPTGRGTGGEAVFRFLYGDQARYFEAEVKPRIKHKKRGTVSMANNGENLHGSQFFITLGEDLDYLDGVHTVFGEVVEGFDVLDKINEAICDEEHRPYQDIRINHTVIIDDPYDDPSDLPIPDRSPEPTKEQLDSGRIGADEEIDDTKGKTVEEIEEMMEERELKTGTQILEMVGDIPDADIKPPDNVLFVCKLNPVTRDEDLEIIFSRFGPIKSCEVIKEQKTGESLQYAFIEFENVEDCERAYFKMDNVLIDDRRIHVDFSQSVSKLKFQKQGAKPILPEKRSNNTAQLTLKDKAKKSNYDLVFDDEDDHQVKSNKGNKRDHDSSDEEGYKQEKNQDKKNRESSTRKQSKRDDYDFHNRKSKRKHESEDRGRRKGTRYYSTSSEEDSKEKKTKKPKEGVTLRPPKHSEDTRQREESRRKQNSEDYYRSRQQWDYSPRHKEKDKDRHSHNRDKQRHSEGHSGKQSSQDERRHRDRYRH